MRSIVIIVDCLALLMGCKKGGNSNTSPLEASYSVTPSTITEGQDYQISFTANGADGPVEASYTLSRPDKQDSVIQRSLTPSQAQFTFFV